MKRNLIFFTLLIMLPCALHAMESKISEKNKIIESFEALITNGTLEEFKVQEKKLNNVSCATIQQLQRKVTLQQDALEILNKVTTYGGTSSDAYQILKTCMKKVEKYSGYTREYIIQEQKKIAHIQTALKEQEDQFIWPPLKYYKDRNMYGFADPFRKNNNPWYLVAHYIIHTAQTSQIIDAPEYSKDILKTLHKVACINSHAHTVVNYLIRKNLKRKNSNKNEQ